MIPSRETVLATLDRLPRPLAAVGVGLPAVFGMGLVLAVVTALITMYPAVTAHGLLALMVLAFAWLVGEMILYNMEDD